jgi:NinB protein
MSDKNVFFLVNDEVRRNAKRCIDAVPSDFMVEVRKRKRLESQNAKFHAMLGDICKQHLFFVQGVPRRLKPIEAKVLFISGHAVATKEGAEMMQGLEGEMVNIRESSANMTITRMASLIEYTAAWGAEHDIKFSAGHWYAEDSGRAKKA